MSYLTLAAILLTAQVAPAPAATPADPIPQATPPGDPATPDVVVMARKLRRLRLVYQNDGRSLRFCTARTSSGDRKLDEMACKVLGWCVRKGFDEPDRALGCLHWWQARMDDIAAAADAKRTAAAPAGKAP